MFWKRGLISFIYDLAADKRPDELLAFEDFVDIARVGADYVSADFEFTDDFGCFLIQDEVLSGVEFYL
jgi:hypothetical protein